MKLHFKNARLLCPENKLDVVADLFVVEGIIASTHKKPDGFTADKEIDAKGCWLLPGLIDLSAHCREPGSTQKGTIASETYAAASGGVTSICCPADTAPVIDTPSVVELIQERAKNASSRIYPIGALTKDLQGTAITEMAALQKAGCVGVGNAKKPVTDTQVLYNAFAYAATFNLPVFYDARDFYLGRGGCVHEGLTSQKLGLRGIPSTNETIAMHTAIELARVTGVKLHLCRVSSKEAVQLIRRAKEEMPTLTCDVAIHHLFLIDHDVSGFDSNFHVDPPLRAQEDQQALLAGLADGTIDAICSDHTPHEQNVKLMPFPESLPGIASVETLLPLLHALSHKYAGGLLQLLNHVTAKPAKIIGVTQGKLNIGAPADLVLFNPETAWQLTPTTQISCGKNSPFHEWPLQGKVVNTFVSGKMVFETK